MLHEILGFNADVICLQEVDEKAFDLFLNPHMELAGETAFTKDPVTPDTSGNVVAMM